MMREKMETMTLEMTVSKSGLKATSASNTRVTSMEALATILALAVSPQSLAQRTLL